MPLDGINAVNNPSFENPELAREIEQDNLEYRQEQESATPEKTQEMKDNIMESIYGVKKNENKAELSGDLENEESNNELFDEDIKKFQESREFPIVREIIENNGIIFEPNFYDIAIEDGKIDVDLLSVDNDIKEEINIMLKKISVENQEKNKLDFSKKINELDLFDSYDTKVNSDGNFNSDVLNIIGKFYIEVPGNDFKDNIELSINTSKNDILSNVQNINRNTKTFEKCIEKIESGDINEMILGLETLYNLAYSGEGKFAKKKLDLLKKGEEKKLIAEANEIDAKYKKAIEQGNEKSKKELLAKMEDMKAQVRELVSGEVFAAGEIDKITDNLTEGKEVA